MTHIITNRLIIRNFDEDDASLLFELLSKPQADCYLHDSVDNLDAVKKIINSRKTDNQVLAVCLTSTGSLIGELFWFPDEPDTFNVGWNFLQEFQGQGYATEAVRAFFNELFINQRARRIFAYVEEDNIRSQKLCCRLGMRHEGRFIDFISFRNNEDGTPKYVNTLQYAILSREWEINSL